MTINERVSDERIENLIEVLSFYSPEDKRLANNESELASALRELQQYRAAAEPVVYIGKQMLESLCDEGGRICGRVWRSNTDELSGESRIPLYASPQVTSAPDDYFTSLVSAARARADKAMRKFPQPNYVLNKVAEENGEVIKAVIHYTEGRETWINVEGEIIDNLAMLIRLVQEGDQVIGFTPPNACRAAMLTAAPAVQAEQLSGNAEQVSQTYTLPADYLQGHKDGCEWAARMAEANHPQTGDWLFDDPIELAKAIRKGPDMLPAEPGNSPVIPEGWTGSDKANAALVMLDRIDTVDPVDDDRIEGIKRIIRELAAAPKQEAE